MRIRWTWAAVVLATSLVACTDGTAGERADLDGVASIDPVRIEDAEVRDVPLGERPAVLDTLDDDRLLVAYLGSPQCSDEPWTQEPTSITASYSDDIVTLTVDPFTSGCEDADDAPFVAGIEITLAESVEGRLVETWYAR